MSHSLKSPNPLKHPGKGTQKEKTFSLNYHPQRLHCTRLQFSLRSPLFINKCRASSSVPQGTAPRQQHHFLINTIHEPGKGKGNFLNAPALHNLSPSLSMNEVSLLRGVGQVLGNTPTWTLPRGKVKGERVQAGSTQRGCGGRPMRHLH